MKQYQVISLDTSDDTFNVIQGLSLDQVIQDAYKGYIADIIRCQHELEDSDYKALTPEQFGAAIRSDRYVVQCRYSHIVYELLTFDIPNRIEVPLGSKRSLVAEVGADENYKEIFVGLMENGLWVQDFVIVGEEYKYGDNDEIIPNHDQFSLKVYSNAENEDFTHDFIVDRYEERR